MTMLLEVLRGQRPQAADGPRRHRQAWDGMLELVSPIWSSEEMWGRGSCLPDGGAALAMALYLIAEEHQVHPGEVHRTQVEALLPVEPASQFGMTSGSAFPMWEERLRALGHDLDAGTDLVSVSWRVLRRDNSPDEVYFDSLHRWDRGFIEGLRAVLAPRYAHALAF